MMLATHDQHRWRCACGSDGPWEADRGEAIAGGLLHAHEQGHEGQVHLETIGAFTGPSVTAVTVSVGSADDAEGCR